MPARKNTAHRPSQAHLEFVTTKDGRRVRNTAYTGGAPKTSPVSRKPLAPKPASNPADPDEAENVISAALDQLETSTSKTDFAESVKPGTGVTSSDGSVTSARFLKPVRVYAASGNHYNVESVHVVDDTSDTKQVAASLAEAFQSLRVKKAKSGTRPTQVGGRSKRLVITSKGDYVVDAGVWTSPLNGSDIVTAATVSLQNDDWVRTSHGDRRDEEGIARLMAAEIVKAMEDD